MSITKVIAIPYISDRTIELMGAKIRPIVKVKGVKHFLGGYTVEEMKNTSFSFTSDHGEHLQEPVNDNELEFVGEAYTLHTWGAPSYFKPSIKEVIAQIPADIKNSVDAFEVELESYPSNKEFVSEAFAKGYHVALTKFYRKK